MTAQLLQMTTPKSTTTSTTKQSATDQKAGDKNFEDMMQTEQQTETTTESTVPSEGAGQTTETAGTPSTEDNGEELSWMQSMFAFSMVTTTPQAMTGEGSGITVPTTQTTQATPVDAAVPQGQQDLTLPMSALPTDSAVPTTDTTKQAAMIQTAVATESSAEVEGFTLTPIKQEEPRIVEVTGSTLQPSTTPIRDYVPTTPIVASGQAAPTEATISENYMQQLQQQIADRVMAGQQEFVIQLTPESLGTLTIKATMEAGQVMVSIICNDGDTMQAVARNAAELGSILESRSGVSTQVVVDKPMPDYLQQESGSEHHGGQPSQEEERQNKQHAEQMDFLQHLRLGLELQ